jgi:hypothetical protein
MPQKLYTLRVQQRDSDANWSPWSNWSTSLQTGSQIAPNLDCDFDTNSSCDVTDLNSLLVALGGGDLRFDLDGSGTVDLNDRDEWLTSAGMDNIGVPFVVGDADLDGEVDAGDLNSLGRNWQSADNPLWQQGNFNGDTIVDAQDLNAIARNWQHGVSSAASSAAVPEPSSLILLATGIGLLAILSRR